MLHPHDFFMSFLHIFLGLPSYLLNACLHIEYRCPSTIFPPSVWGRVKVRIAFGGRGKRTAESLVSLCHISKVSIWVVCPFLYLIPSGIFLSFFFSYSFFFFKKNLLLSISLCYFTLDYAYQLFICWVLFHMF